MGLYVSGNRRRDEAATEGVKMLENAREK